MKFFEVIVVGAGPAGSALAALLSQQGLHVALLERDRFPRDKLCGEFLSPESRSYFERIGCLDRVLELGPARIDRARFSSAAGQCVELPLQGEGFGLSRRSLDETLFRFAADCGVVTLEGAEVGEVWQDHDVPKRCSRVRVGTQVFGADLVVLAYGRRSSLDRRFRRPFLAQSHANVGFQQHRTPKSQRLLGELTGAVEIHAFAGGYCGLNFVEGGVINVCAFVSRSLLKRLPHCRWEELEMAMRTMNPALDARLDELAPTRGRTLAVAQVALGHKECRQGAFPLIGDAAGMVAPLCGGGQVAALRSALVLADLCVKMRGSKGARSSSVATRWEKCWRRESRVPLILGRCLQAVLPRRLLSELVLACIRRIPFLGRGLLAATRFRG